MSPNCSCSFLCFSYDSFSNFHSPLLSPVSFVAFFVIPVFFFFILFYFHFCLECLVCAGHPLSLLSSLVPISLFYPSSFFSTQLLCILSIPPFPQFILFHFHSLSLPCFTGHPFTLFLSAFRLSSLPSSMYPLHFSCPSIHPLPFPFPFTFLFVHALHLLPSLVPILHLSLSHLCNLPRHVPSAQCFPHATPANTHTHTHTRFSSRLPKQRASHALVWRRKHEE